MPSTLPAGDPAPARPATDTAGTLFINGKERPLPAPPSVQGALEALGLDDRPVAVELNGSLVRRTDHDRAALGPGDRLEIVTFVGGG